MKIFIDSADVTEIKKYISSGICDGVTTNPTICLKCGVKNGIQGVMERTSEIAKLVFPKPVSVEVTSEDPEEILRQAREYSRLADNIAVKITVIDSKGNSFLPLAYKLVSEGIRVNVTAITTFNQAIFAAKAIQSGLSVSSSKAPHFVSIFGGRISEEQGSERAFKIIEDFRKWLDIHNMQGIEIIVGSVRSQENVECWSRTGAHILTITPEVLNKCLCGARTKETVSQFLEDSKKTMERFLE